MENAAEVKVKLTFSLTNFLFSEDFPQMMSEIHSFELKTRSGQNSNNNLDSLEVKTVFRSFYF